jgi:predicted AAA+ superfamily ATPase
MGEIRKRHLKMNLPAGQSAFLWGPRRVGKSHWLREAFGSSDVQFIDLLKTDLFAELVARPSLLRERFDGRTVIIDEVQKVPALLDEVHGLIETRGAQFVLTGSSARKLRRSHANLLAGRAWRFELGPLSYSEVSGFDLNQALQSGLLPPHFLSTDPKQDLRAYIGDYLKEEIAGEAATRNLPAFAEFLRVAALTNSELINYTNVARETGISAKVVRGYFEILEDTLLGARLPPWSRAKNRRMILTEKFYFFDVGVANHLARRTPVPGTPDYGKSFEHFILMELMNYRRYRAPDLPLAFWRTSTGREVDFLVGDIDLAVECKSAARVHDGDLVGLRALAEEQEFRHRIVVSLESEPRRLDDGIEVLPWDIFLDRLWAGEFV